MRPGDFHQLIDSTIAVFVDWMSVPGQWLARGSKTLGDRRAALLKAHGVVIAGADIIEMVAAAFILEDNARRTWTSAAIGNVEFLSDEIMAEIEAEALSHRGPFKRIWALCESEYERD